MSFPKEVDNSMREAFVVCPTKAHYAYIEDLAPKAASVHLHFGGAAAAGFEATRRAYFERGIAPAQAIQRGIEAAITYWGDFDPPPASYKTLASLRELIPYYFAIWPLDTDGLIPKDIEWRFRVPIPGITHPDDGGEIFYVGRSDAPGDLNGLYVIEDDKTAGSLGPLWSKQWDLDSQFTGYVWAAQEEGKMPLDGPGPVLLRGVSVLSPKHDEVSDPDGDITKTVGRGKSKHEERFRLEYNRAESFGHAQVLTYRPPWMVERWKQQMIRDVKRMIYAYLNDQWDLALHKNACAAYGGCPYKDLCMSREPNAWIPINYVRQKWNPLAKV